MNRVELSGLNTRAATDFNFVLPKPSLDIFKRSFMYCGPQHLSMFKSLRQKTLFFKCPINPTS